MSEQNSQDNKDKEHTSPSSGALPNDRPAAVQVEKGKIYWWCSCGKTTTVPFCDNSHAGTKYLPVIYQAQETKVEHFCGCSGTGNKPFCDGTHQYKFGGGREEYYRR